MFQVECHAQLVTKPVKRRDRNIVFMLPGERASLGAQVGRVGAAAIRAGRVLDFDNRSAETRQQQRGERAGQRRGQMRTVMPSRGVFFIGTTRRGAEPGTGGQKHD